MNQELKTLVIWLSSNKLSLNISKTHFIAFKSVNKKVSNPTNIFIDCLHITQVESTKFL